MFNLEESFDSIVNDMLSDLEREKNTENVKIFNPALNGA